MVLTADVAANGNVLVVGHRACYVAPGVHLVINAGAASEEVAEVATDGRRRLLSVVSVALSAGLQFAHNAGENVALSTTASPTTASPTTASPITASPTTAAPTTVAPTTAAPTQTPTTLLQRFIAMYDTNGDGTLSEDEFMMLKNPHGLDPHGIMGQYWLTHRFSALDTNNDGQISDDEVEAPGAADIITEIMAQPPSTPPSPSPSPPSPSPAPNSPPPPADPESGGFMGADDSAAGQAAGGGEGGGSLLYVGAGAGAGVAILCCLGAFAYRRRRRSKSGKAAKPEAEEAPPRATPKPANTPISAKQIALSEGTNSERSSGTHSGRDSRDFPQQADPFASLSYDGFDGQQAMDGYTDYQVSAGPGRQGRSSLSQEEAFLSQISEMAHPDQPFAPPPRPTPRASVPQLLPAASPRDPFPASQLASGTDGDEKMAAQMAAQMANPVAALHRRVVDDKGEVVLDEKGEKCDLPLDDEKKRDVGELQALGAASPEVQVIAAKIWRDAEAQGNLLRRKAELQAERLLRDAESKADTLRARAAREAKMAGGSSKDDGEDHSLEARIVSRQLQHEAAQAAERVRQEAEKKVVMLCRLAKLEVAKLMARSQRRSSSSNKVAPDDDEKSPVRTPSKGGFDGVMPSKGGAHRVAPYLAPEQPAPDGLAVHPLGRTPRPVPDDELPELEVLGVDRGASQGPLARAGNLMRGLRGQRGNRVQVAISEQPGVSSEPAAEESRAQPGSDDESFAVLPTQPPSPPQPGGSSSADESKESKEPSGTSVRI